MNHKKTHLDKSSKISVCMATYNGEKYIFAQVESILSQLSEQDELIIVDDFSTDETIKIINSFQDSRIHLSVNNENLGHVATFEKALIKASGSYILLCDQDDIWPAGRVDKLIPRIQFSIGICASNFSILEPSSFLEGQGSNLRFVEQDQHFRNIIGIFLGKVPYWGCTMAMTHAFKELALPFPKHTEAHDLWLALLGNLTKSIQHEESVTLLRRLHAENLTPQSRRPLKQIATSRLLLLHSLCVGILRTLRYSGKIHEKTFKESD